MKTFLRSVNYFFRFLKNFYRRLFFNTLRQNFQDLIDYLLLRVHLSLRFALRFVCRVSRGRTIATHSLPRKYFFKNNEK